MTTGDNNSTPARPRVLVWLAAHRFAACGVALLVGSLLLVAGSVMLHRPAVNLNPQEQVGVPWIKPPGSEVAYAGNEACRSCHPGEFESHSRSPHAHTVKAIMTGEQRPEFSSGQTVLDDRNGIRYAVRTVDGKNQMVATTGDGSKDASARWVFGSGNQAFTCLGQNGDKFLQFRISYYPPATSWNFTPGGGPGTPLQTILGDVYNPGEAAACFGCHSTVLVGSRSHLDLEHSRLNVGCESCHGPSKSHIESVKAAAAAGGNHPAGQSGIIKPARYDGPQIMKLCGACHRIPVAQANASTASSAELARFPGIALPRSRCFIASEGKLSCITCHNPHQSVKQQTEVSFDAKCISCHSAPHGTVCSHGETAACVSCHMPAENIARRLSLRFHNHWIRKEPELPN